MNENSHKISAAQLFCILLLMRVTAELVYPTAGGFGGSGVLAVLTAELIRFLLALPVLIYSFKGRSFYAAIWQKNRFCGWASAIGAALLLTAFVVRTLIYTAQFVQRNLLNHASVLLVMLLLAGFTAYAAAKGCEALARAGVLFMAAAAAVTLLVIIGDIPYFDAGRDMPAWTFDTFLTDGASRLIRGGEYLVFAALLPCVREKGDTRKTRAGSVGLWFALGSSVISMALCLFFGAVLGEYCSMTDYPAAAAASLSDVILFKRLDGLFCALWALCAAFRMGVMAFAAFAVIKECASCADRQTAGKESCA